MTVNNPVFYEKLNDAIDNYYSYNPDTLMPLLMTALATQGKLQLGYSHSEGTTVLCEINPKEVINYEWVQLNPTLRKKIKEHIAAEDGAICVEGFINESLIDIYNIFHHYDTFTVEEEYHHRIGVLYHHSSNKASEQAHRQYATICLAEALLATPTDWLKNNFLEISNSMLVKSGLQPKRPRLDVAYTLKALLKYDGRGTVYNPFAGCAIAAAVLEAGNNMYADGNENDKLFAVARLLNYGMGGSNEHYAQRDSTKWNYSCRFDYIMSTYRGYIKGRSAFDFCLSKCFETLSENGKFAGIASPKDIFEEQSENFKEALKRDWVETIVLLPFGEVAVLVNTQKEKALKSKVRFFNLNHLMHRNNPIHKVIQNDLYAEILRVSDIKKKGYLRSLITIELGERDGHEIITLGSIVKKLKKQTFSLNRIREDERVLASIDRNVRYNAFTPWMNGIVKKRISSLFAPAYHMTCDCLITNNRGKLEPRLFDADCGSAYFQDGYAFELCDPDFRWVILELNQEYVLRQLHPYGMDEMIPEAMTEEQILNLKLYKEIEDIDIPDSEPDHLPCGYELTGNKSVYTIHRFLGNGSFGYAYSALAKNLATGEDKEVVLKEFYPHGDFHREGDDLKAVVNEDTNFDIDAEREKFCEEAEIMRKLGNTPDSHIVPTEELFESEKTGTLYYVMPFYHAGSLDDLQKSCTAFTEELLINNIAKPLCQALHTAHNSKVLHLDIKPENILVDDNGFATLTDFGVAKQYDEGGSIINRKGVHGTSVFAAPEMRTKGAMIKFGCEPDIFGLAATLYNLATQSTPHPIEYNSDEDEDLRFFMKHKNMSDAFIDAVIAGLQAAAPARPRNAQEFLNMFPGCEEIKL